MFRFSKKNDEVVYFLFFSIQINFENCGIDFFAFLNQPAAHTIYISQVNSLSKLVWPKPIGDQIKGSQNIQRFTPIRAGLLYVLIQWFFH